MATILNLNKSITDLPPNDGMSLIKRVRASRRIPVVSTKKKKSPGQRASSKAKKQMKLTNPADLVNSMSGDDLKKLIAALEGGKK